MLDRGSYKVLKATIVSYLGKLFLNIIVSNSLLIFRFGMF